MINAMVNDGDNILIPELGYPFYQGLNQVKNLC